MNLVTETEEEAQQVADDLGLYGVAYFRINLEGKLERLDPMKVRIRQPWDRPPE